MPDKQTVRGPIVPPTEDAQKIQATRRAEAETLAVERHQKINMVWEYTQAYMAIMVITTVVATSIYVIVASTNFAIQQRIAALLFLTNLASLVAGFYFGRTNHTRPTGESKDG